MFPKQLRLDIKVPRTIVEFNLTNIFLHVSQLKINEGFGIKS